MPSHTPAERARRRRERRTSHASDEKESALGFALPSQPRRGSSDRSLRSGTDTTPVANKPDETPFTPVSMQMTRKDPTR